ncbi:hypothetical protein TSTA_038890 [Talaromyces stipitatus ATCC 10500]|uniref:Heterokaryon incompatibility domain-containing protein n=1 Tax=Talaromyces stipitatus (strain ATCC 10500 / CBS 375.48 / QM 6759 / NRRL 1006) TaxID=441959 RepID=B8M3U1_TALSN|nr:uncharacterized protein TSTA_038890 [Talaromyces stipitatus ATCC 10500]EED20684.1 hypothetical protein TSTA_038890 [Talaromyces stipitatus ATCC 10500]
MRPLWTVHGWGITVTAQPMLTRPVMAGVFRFEPIQAQIIDILQQEGLPLLRASIANHSAVKVEVIKHQIGMKYTAISHIWSDGLGNEDQYWLLELQFKQLVKAVNAAKGGRRTTRVPSARHLRPGAEIPTKRVPMACVFFLGHG